MENHPTIGYTCYPYVLSRRVVIGTFEVVCETQYAVFIRSVCNIVTHKGEN